MASQKLVRCEIRRRGHSDAATPRYIPLEIYGLWEYLISTRHGFEVVSQQASLWLDMEDAPEAAYGESQFDRVTEVSLFVYSDRDDMFTRVCRYLPSQDCEALKRIILSHYPPDSQRVQPHIRERSGIWVHRRAATP